MRKSAIAKYGYGVLLLALGVAQVLTAWPRLQASLAYLPVEAALHDGNPAQDLDNAKLNGLISKVKASLAIAEQPRYWADLSQLLFLQALKSSPAQQTPLLKQARDSVKRALAISPADSLLWFQLARLDVLLNVVSKNTVKALTLSIMTGPFEYGHLLPRLQLSLFLLPQFEPKDYSLLQSQILIAWEKQPKLFIKEIALKNKNFTKLTVLLRNQSPLILKAMETEIEKAH